MLDAARSKNITSTSKNAALAYYCIKASVPVKHVTATLDFDAGEIAASFDDFLTSCPGADVVVRTFTSAGDNTAPGANRRFWVVFN